MSDLNDSGGNWPISKTPPLIGSISSASESGAIPSPQTSTTLAMLSKRHAELWQRLELGCEKITALENEQRRSPTPQRQAQINSYLYHWTGLERQYKMLVQAIQIQAANEGFAADLASPEIVFTPLQ